MQKFETTSDLNLYIFFHIAVSLSRHADIVNEDLFSQGQRAKLLVFKVIKVRALI